MFHEHDDSWKDKKPRKYKAVYDNLNGKQWWVVDQWGEHVAGFMGEGAQKLARENAQKLNNMQRGRK